MPSVHLGVDFGTSHTVAVLNRDGAAVPLLFDSSPVLASAVYADPDGGLLTGADAVDAARFEPARCEPHPKRRIDDGRILLGDEEFGVEEVFAAVLARVRRESERMHGAVLADVTLTHPAAWGSARRLVLEDAAGAAGFTGARLLPEPVAAATYFTGVLGHDLTEGSGIVVADLGGGTFDASVVARRGAALEVLAVDGIGDLGGVDFDHALVTLLGDRLDGNAEWSRLVNPRTTQDRRLRRAMYEDVRSAKERLSRQTRVDVPVPLLDSDTHLTREELEQLARPLLERAVRMTAAVIRASRRERLSGVLLVGGASRMPLVASMLHQALGTAPIVLEQPELVVAQGATLTGHDPGPVDGSVPVSGPAAMTVSPRRPDTSGPVTSPAAPHWESPEPVTSPGPVPGVHAPPTMAGPFPAGPSAWPGTAVGGPVPRQPDPAPTTVRASQILMWIHTALGAVWVLGFVALYSETAEGHPTLPLAMLTTLPMFIALSPVGTGIAAVRFGRREPWTRAFAFGVSLAAAVFYLVVMVFMSTTSSMEVVIFVVPGVVYVSLSISCALLLNTESSLRWFNPVPDETPRPVPPGIVRLIRVLMWIHTVLGAALIPVFAPELGDDAIEYNIETDNLDINQLLIFLDAFLPVAIAVGVAVMGTAAVRLRNPIPAARTLAFAVNVVIVVCYGIAVIGMSQVEVFGSDFPADFATTVLAVILTALSALCAGFLSGSVARRWFAAPPQRT